MALPDFGLMTKADKLKLDAIDTTTLLTKTEAATTYATKAEMREYIKQVVESDTGFVFINGNDSEVGVIPAFNVKENPNLSLSTNAVTMAWQSENYHYYGSGSSNVTVTRAGNGDISADCEDTNVTLSVSGTTVTVGLQGGMGDKDESTPAVNATVTVTSAETDDYASGSAVFTVTAESIALSAGGGSMPTPEP